LSADPPDEWQSLFESKVKEQLRPICNAVLLHQQIIIRCEEADITGTFGNSLRGYVSSVNDKYKAFPARELAREELAKGTSGLTNQQVQDRKRLLDAKSTRKRAPIPLQKAQPFHLKRRSCSNRNSAAVPLEKAQPF